MSVADIKKALAQIRKPYPGVRYALVQYPLRFGIRVFEDNIMEFSTDQRVNILEYLELLRKTVESFGYTCHLEGVQGKPRA